jgi:hypothetical protein
MLHAGADYLARADWAGLGGYEQGKALRSLGGITHRVQGGETALDNLKLLCLAHHHHFIHRLGWNIRVHPDGSSDAISPRGRVIRGHGPRAPAPPG